MNDCRIIPFETIASAVAELCGKAACDLPPDVLDRLKVMEKQETGELAADFFRQLDSKTTFIQIYASEHNSDCI